MENKELRNEYVVLQVLLEKAKAYLKLMCEFSEEQNKRKRIRRKGDYGKQYSLSDNQLYWCIKALHTGIVLSVANMFDHYEKKHKKAISFRTVAWFKDDKQAKEVVDKLYEEDIIGEIIRTRHTWGAHAGDKMEDIISVEGICKSNLKEIFGKLDDLWFWFNQSRQSAKR